MGNKPSNSSTSGVKISSDVRPPIVTGCSNNSTVPSRYPFDNRTTTRDCCRKINTTESRRASKSKERPVHRTPFACRCQSSGCEKHPRTSVSNSVYPVIMADDTVPLTAKKPEPIHKTFTGTNTNASCIHSRTGSANKYRSDQRCCHSELGSNPQSEAQIYRIGGCKMSGGRKIRSKMEQVLECQVPLHNTPSQTIVQSSGPRNPIGPLFAAIPSLQRLKELLETFSSLFSVLPDDLRNANEKLLDFQLLCFGDEDSIHTFSSNANSMLATMRNLLPSLERHIFVAQDLSYALHRLEERIATFHKLLAQVKTPQNAIKY